MSRPGCPVQLRGPMARWDAETARGVPLPTILVVGCSPGFVARCVPVARSAGATVRGAGIAACATQAARWRPLAIVVPEQLYEFDREAFDALAIDVMAEVFTISSEDAPQVVLEAMIPLSILAASRRRAALRESSRPPT